VQDFRVVDLGVVLVLASSTFYLEGKSLFRIAMDKNMLSNSMSIAIQGYLGTQSI
jgi:hypothetical protein